MCTGSMFVFKVCFPYLDRLLLHLLCGSSGSRRPACHVGTLLVLTLFLYSAHCSEIWVQLHHRMSQPLHLHGSSTYIAIYDGCARISDCSLIHRLLSLLATDCKAGEELSDVQHQLYRNKLLRHAYLLQGENPS